MNKMNSILETCRFTTYEMTAYIMRALALEDATNLPSGKTFKMYGYGGSLKDLFFIVDELAVSDGKIQKIIDTPLIPWGCGWDRRNPGTDTNLNYAEINLFMESVHYLLNQQIIGPGNARDVSADLPWIHVTEYGKLCLSRQDILPYDSDGYLQRIQSCSQHDDWDIYYIDQVLKCFNCGIYDASAMMLGIESEYLTGRLIDNYLKFLDKHETNEKAQLDTILSGCNGKISLKYNAYYSSLKKIRNKKDQATNCFLYPDLYALAPRMDDTANSTFMNYLRLTRNELAHPSSTKMDPTETMLMIVAFIKYYSVQNDFLDFYIANS